MKRYITIHGHFYQPPRENPWLEAIEREDSAHPYHDWNERISAECYAPNALARVLDEKQTIIRIVNNYSRMSFNFGPTLLSWMERHQKHIYEAILQADKESQTRFSGHGSAIAQAYSHLIMPLASDADQTTQVRWGIADFVHRFGRRPEGMWLPETAVNTKSLEALAAEGIAFTILAPRQAKAFRALGQTKWTELADARVDPSRAYRINLPSGASIAVFFYDGPTSQAIAFEGLLHKGEFLAHRLLDGFDKTRTHDQLVHVATDGETYGHHHRSGEMALAYALSYLETNSLAELTNYGEYLALHPPTHEAQIVEDSSWSCAHGVERWRSDCGCSTGGRPDWNQAWRGPLRAALDWLRDEVTPRFLALGGRLFRSATAARDAYVNIILDRTNANISTFFEQHASHELSSNERGKALKLLELSRHAMLMYTSCGWFFDDVSGIEGTQILSYAFRVVELAAELFETPEIERTFLSMLGAAKSNIPEMRDARAVVERRVRPSMVDLPKVAAHYAMTSLFSSYPEATSLHAYSVVRGKETRLEMGPTQALVGQATLRSELTEDTRTLTYAALFVGEHNLHAGVRERSSEAEYDSMLKDLGAAFGAADLPDAIRVLDRHFGQLPYGMRALFRDDLRTLTAKMVEPMVKESEAMFRQTYERNAPLMRFLSSLDAPLPRAFRATSELAFHSEILSELAAPELDVKAIRALIAGALTGKVALDDAAIGYALGGRIHELTTLLARSPDDLAVAAKLIGALEIAHALPVSPSLWEAQNVFYRIANERLAGEREKRAKGDGASAAWAAAYETLGVMLRVKIV